MSKVKDISGQTINEWTVIREYGRNKSGRATFLCKCSCGKTKVVDGYSIRSGASTNCGCRQKINLIEASKKVTTKHGGRNERLYGVWLGIKHRCNNPNSKYYARYGGRGIQVCGEWDNSYANFREWALSNGYNSSLPKGSCTIERVDNDKGYSPMNCIWANSKTQCNNRSSNHIITHNGVSHTISEWSDITGIRKDTLRRRIEEYGWSIERAIEEPTHKYNTIK